MASKICHVIRTERKHRRDGMSILASSRNVQWSAEGATKSLYSRAYNLVNLSGLRSGNFDERTEKKFEKNEIYIFLAGIINRLTS